MSEFCVQVKCEIVLNQYHSGEAIRTGSFRYHTLTLPTDCASDPAKVDEAVRQLGEKLAKETQDYVSKISGDPDWDWSATQDVPVSWAPLKPDGN